MTNTDAFGAQSHLSVFPAFVSPGECLGVWVQGCPLACSVCMSRAIWDPADGLEADVDQLAERWRCAIQDGATGL